MRIAVDGPAGAGKSTIARLLAEEMGYIYIDTGAMYRAVALKALRSGISSDDESGIVDLAAKAVITFQADAGRGQRTFLDGEDVSEPIRSVEVSDIVSDVARHTGVRRIMVKQQQAMAVSGNVIMDGRDIGEIVMPDAEYKFFITASLEERVRRRQGELQAAGNSNPADTVRLSLEERDHGDATREFGALKVLDDSIVIDSTNMSIKELKEYMLKLIRERERHVI